MEGKFTYFDINCNDYFMKKCAESYAGWRYMGHLENNGNQVVVFKPYLDFAKSVQNFLIFEDDVWICGLPKTGTTWIKEMVWLLTNDLNFEGVKKNLDTRIPLLEGKLLVSTLLLGGTDNTIDRNEEKYQCFYNSVEYVDKMQRPRCIKTHLPWKWLPKQMTDDTVKPKIIYITRNPKDTLVSLYYYLRNLKVFTGSIDILSRMFLEGYYMYQYWDHIFEFWNRRNESNILFVKYEDMKRDLSAIIRQVAQFLNKTVTEEQVVQLCEYLSLNSMKNNPVYGFKDHPIYKNLEGGFIREGKIGGHKNDLSSEIIEQFDRWTEENTRDTGLNFE